MRWMWFDKISTASCTDIVTFRGKFYVTHFNNYVFVIDPYSLILKSLNRAPQLPSEDLGSVNSLVPSGNDEFFLVERIFSTEASDPGNFPCRVCRLDEDAGEWVVVTELGDRVLLIGAPGNSSCSAKEFPDGCGVSGNSFLFTYELFNDRYFYKYGVDTGNAENNINLWRKSRETVLRFLNTWPMLAFRAESSIL